MVAPAKPLLEGSKRSVRELLELHDELADKGGGVVVLGGPRGVGKALLLSELRRELSARGRLVLFGRAEQAAPHPFAALREPAAQALAFLEARGLAEDFLDAHARALAVLLPTLQHQPAPRARDKTGFLEALRAFFIELSRAAPLTVLLSDLHYADDDTREAVRFLAQHLFNPDVGEDDVPGVLMVGARTDDDGGPAFARSLSAGKRARMFDVAGLTRAQLVEYLGNHALLDKLLAASRGRPEDVDELLESLPRDTDALLLQRVDALDPVARRALRALAVLSRPAPPDLLSAIVQAPVGEVAHALGQLVEQRMLARRLQNGELLFTFSRPHHQEVLKENLPADERAALHHAVAGTLEQRGSELSEPLLAFHFLRGTHPQRAVPWVLAACERLLLTFAYGTVVDLVGRTLPVASSEERFALLGHLVEAQRLRGDLRGALATAAEMRTLASKKQLPTVLRRIGELLSARGDHRAALEVLEETRTLGEAPAAGDADADDADADADDDADGDVLPERALVLAAMAEVNYMKSDLDAAERLAEEAARAAPDAPMAFRLRNSNTLGKVAYSRDRFDDAEARFLSNLELAEEHGLEHESILARVNTGLARHRRGHNDEAREMLERALSSAQAAGDLHSESNALLNLGAIEQRSGELGRSLERYKAAWARFSRLGDRNAVRRVTWNLANLTCALGDYEASQTWLEQSRRLAESDDSDRGRAFVHFTEGDLAFNQGQPGAALASYEKARELFLRIGETSRVVEMTAKAAWAAILLGDLGSAEERVAELPAAAPGTLPHARRSAVEGALALSKGDDDAVRGLSLLSQAVDEMDKLRAHDDAWRTLAFLADRFEGRGDPKSADAARARARAFVEATAERLPPALREVMLRDNARAALFGAAAVADDAGEAAEGAADETLRPQQAPAPAVRKPEWDARYPELVGRSPTLLRVFDRLDRIARSKNATVLIRGESGTGKELVAAAVHRLSERAHGPFVRVNCAALVETLLMSELFGHEKGSFTGALARKIGRFELARGGTIFLDEIGDISPKTQVSLLRVLQERQFERVGGTQTISTDAVVICATHRDLESMVKDGSFREDLYYRLRGVVVEMPALRERPDDIPVLSTRFLSKTRDEVGRAPLALSPEAEAVLMRHRWPGNIRELQNVIRSVALFCEGDVVDVEHLAEFPELFDAAAPVAHAAPVAPAAAPLPARAPLPVRPPLPAARPAAPREQNGGRPADVLGRVAAGADEGIALGDLKRRLEFEAIANAMRQTGGNITRAAALLRMKRPRLSQIVNGNPELKAIKEASRGEDAED